MPYGPQKYFCNENIARNKIPCLHYKDVYLFISYSNKPLSSRKVFHEAAANSRNIKTNIFYRRANFACCKLFLFYSSGFFIVINNSMPHRNHVCMRIFRKSFAMRCRVPGSQSHPASATQSNHRLLCVFLH